MGNETIEDNSVVEQEEGQETDFEIVNLINQD